MRGLFAEHVERRVDLELANHMSQIISGLEVGADRSLGLGIAPADPRFDTPRSGLYWQIDTASGDRQRSRSLWEHELTLPRDELSPTSLHIHDIAGPEGAVLHVVERSLIVGPEDSPIPLRLSIAIDRKEIDEATREFGTVLTSSLAVLGVALLLALWAMIRIGVRPLSRLGLALQRVHDGSAERIEGTYPSEVQPLVEEMNALLRKEREVMVRARERAGDLAHGFKTPLAILSTIARDLRREGRDRPAAEIDGQIEIMGRHVRRELARARTAGSSAVGQAAVEVRPIVEKIIAALRRISAERDLQWSVTGDAARFAGDEDDLLELVGNICENASKWARSRVAVHLEQGKGVVRLRFEDDGPGIASDARDLALARGKRIDESGDGTGLGLSIVAKTVESYAGSVQLGPSPLGGLTVEVTLPAAVD